MKMIQVDPRFMPTYHQSKNRAQATLPRRGGVFTAARFLSIIIALLFEKHVSCPIQAAMPSSDAASQPRAA